MVRSSFGFLSFSAYFPFGVARIRPHGNPHDVNRWVRQIPTGRQISGFPGFCSTRSTPRERLANSRASAVHWDSDSVATRESKLGVPHVAETVSRPRFAAGCAVRRWPTGWLHAARSAVGPVDAGLRTCGRSAGSGAGFPDRSSAGAVTRYRQRI